MKLVQLLEEKLSKDAIEKWAETADVKKYRINDDLTVDIDQSLSLDATFSQSHNDSRSIDIFDIITDTNSALSSASSA